MTFFGRRTHGEESAHLNFFETRAHPFLMLFNLFFKRPEILPILLPVFRKKMAMGFAPQPYSLGMAGGQLNCG